jgi:hypothetical protein
VIRALLFDLFELACLAAFVAAVQLGARAWTG